jgi:hypothetical protein
MPSPHLERKLKESLGDDAGQELAVTIDGIDPIRGDIQELRHAMQTGFAAQSAALEKTGLELRAAIEASAREQLRYFIAAWGIQVAAIVGLYATVIVLAR